MDANEIKSQLDYLAGVRDAIARARLDARLDELEALAEEAEKNIKAAVMALEEPVKGERLQAVINKGRVTWDSKLLEGYAVAHPEIKAARKEGEPTVTIRKV